jgi:hypothetical protein
LADETLALIGDRPVERTEFGRAVVMTAAP